MQINIGKIYVSLYEVGKRETVENIKCKNHTEPYISYKA